MLWSLSTLFICIIVENKRNNSLYACLFEAGFIRQRYFIAMYRYDWCVNFKSESLNVDLLKMSYYNC